MSQSFEFYDKRAKEAQTAADASSLDNVRDRELRSAAAWRALAKRALDIEQGRRKP